MAELLDDSGLQPKQGISEELQKVRLRLGIMGGITILFWVNVRYFFLDKAIEWSRPALGQNEDASMIHIALNMSTLLIPFFTSFFIIVFSLEFAKKIFTENLVANIISSIISIIAFWVLFLIAGVLAAGIAMAIGFSERFSPDMGFLIVAIGSFWWLYSFFRKRIEKEILESKIRDYKNGN